MSFFPRPGAASDTLYSTNAATNSVAITDSPKVEYLVNISAPATYTVWVRGYADNADADAVNVGQGSDDLSGVHHYTVQYREVGGVWSTLIAETSNTSTSFIPGEEGKSYEFRVQATDNVNNSAWSAVARPVLITGAGVTKYYHFNSQRIAMRRGDAVYYLSGDHLGSVSLTTDSAGAKVAESRCLPYGQERWTSGAAMTDFGFTGQRAEAGFGLMDYQARYYSPYLARFVSADTIVPEPGNPQNLNRYSYVYNNPLNFVDPSGHQGGPWEQVE